MRAPSDPLVRYWHPVAYASDVKDVPIAVRLLDVPLVLFRSNDQIACFNDVCIHRGTALSRGVIQEGCLVCPYHGWTYAASGQCTRIPQQEPALPIPRKARATSYHCVERYGLVWCCLAEPTAEIPSYPEWDDAAFRKVPCGPFTWRTSAARAVENFNDLGHFAWVHPGLIGDPSRPIVHPYTVERLASELRYEVDVEAANPRDAFRIANLHDETAPVIHHTTRVIMPFTSHVRAQFPNGSTRTVYMTCTPVGTRECRIFTSLARDFDHDVPDEEIRAWESRIIGQDQAVVETQRPEELPVDLSAELHIRADLVAVAYRRWLGELGIERYVGEPALAES